MVGRRAATREETGTSYCCKRGPPGRWVGSCCTADSAEAHRIAMLSRYPPELELFPSPAETRVMHSSPVQLLPTKSEIGKR